MEAIETSVSETNTSNSQADIQSISIVRVALPNAVARTTSSTTSAQTYHAIQVNLFCNTLIFLIVCNLIFLSCYLRCCALLAMYG